ncbi:MAG: peroxiredoxin [Ferruginibacter sp.]
MSLEIGTEAPDFSLFDSEKNSVKLGDFRGKNVVLLFFPLAFTSVCTKELCSVRDNISIYNDSNAQVLGISVDSLYTLNKFKKEQNLNFPLLSDFNKETAKEFDVLYETFSPFGMRGVSKRAVFVIDKEGIIQYKAVCSNPGELPDFDAVEQILARLN